MKKFFAEFKKFITRGNVVDMAVGVIVGSSFTAIVNGMSNFILKPIINWILALIFGADSLTGIQTYLKTAYTLDADGNAVIDAAGQPVIDMAKSIYIDWGAFINAVINFFLIALVLFTIVRIFNRIRDEKKEMIAKAKSKKPTRAERKEMKALGINRRDKAAVQAYYDDKAKKAEEEKAAAEEKARLERLANPTTEDLLKEIRDLLLKQAQ